MKKRESGLCHRMARSSNSLGVRDPGKRNKGWGAAGIAVGAALCLNLGLAGMSSLKVMPGVREAGTGNAGVASGFGPQAIAWNPAASAGLVGFSAAAGYARWLLDAHQQSFYLVRGLGFASLGLGVTGFTAGEFEYRTEVPTEEPLGFFVPGELNFHLNVSRAVNRLVHAGISGRYYYSKIMERQTSGAGFDLGVRVMPVQRLAVGASLVDFGWNLSYYRERFRLPTRARLGAGYGFSLSNSLSLNLAADAALYVYTKDLNIHSGAELVVVRLLALRGGYEWLSGTGRPGFGLGLNRGPFRLDYSLTLLNDDLGAAHRIGLGLGK